MNNKVLWKGVVDGVRTRICQLASNDCCVEIAGSDNGWMPCEDEHAMHAYLDAFLDTNTALKQVRQSMTQTLRDTSQLLMTVGEFIDVDD